jgi:hypothetical protein
MAAAYLQHTHSVYTEVEKRVNSQVIDPKGYMHMQRNELLVFYASVEIGNYCFINWNPIFINKLL